MTEFNRDNTVIIIGKSPFLNDKEVVNEVNRLKFKYHNIGVNHAAYLFKTEYFAFIDHPLKMYCSMIHPNTKIITIGNYATDKFQGEFFNIYIPKKPEDKPVKDNYLAYTGFTHDICISWAILHEYKNVVLIGAADFMDGGYLDKMKDLPDKKENFVCANKFREMSINYINNEFVKYINVYTANPDSVLTVPRINLKDL